jgi:hypothetical protein
MTDPELDSYVEGIAREARRPVVVDPLAVQRVMMLVRREPLPVRRAPLWRWALQPRSLPLSPLLGAALAAGLVGIGILFGHLQLDRGGRPQTGQPKAVAGTAAPARSSSDTNVIKFVLLAPHASTVSVVGDFNDWDAQATPMTRTSSSGTWSVALRLPAGRHVYAFVVNSAGATKWVADPSAPLAPEDGLGAPNSVVLVGDSHS